MNSTSEIREQPAANMNSANVNPSNVNTARASSWSLWTRQTLAVMSLEIKKKLFEPPRVSALSNRSSAARFAFRARALSAAVGRG